MSWTNKRDSLSKSENSSNDMTTVNTAVHEISGVRLPLQPYSGSHAVFMYSTASDGNVTLQLKEPDDLDRNSLAVVLNRLQEDSSFSIYTQDPDILSDGGIDVLLGPNSSGENSGAASFDFFDSSSGQDLTLSPQTLSNTTEALINDNSDSLGLPVDSDTVSTTTKDDGKPHSMSPEPKGKRHKTKPTSPNRQGPQQCTVCSKVFGNASALAKHKLTHSDERKYVCNVCNKAFKRQDHLNGHMLTHRNKKPYECKADGCGKSYCDARSLRRHTENHHVPPSGSGSTMSPAQGAAAGDAASPHGSSCIQYAPPPTGSPPIKENNGKEKSQLQQLLSSEPVKCIGSSNDGLTKQQLDLIHQIMEQTQKQNHTVSSPSSPKTGSKKVKAAKSKEKTVAAATSTSWSPNSQQVQQCIPVRTISSGAPSPQGRVTTTTPSTPSPTQEKSVLKPVECTLCKRRFKNIPALNGHMRLHGGYFKKDNDPTKKQQDKKDPPGPPLQTASIGVRALIEEKIISKRNSSPTTAFAMPAPLKKDKSLKTHLLHSFNLDQVEEQHFATPSLEDDDVFGGGGGLDLLEIKEDALLKEMRGGGDEGLQELSLDDIASLHDDTPHSVNQDLQAVLNSPLPESLADFSTYHSSKLSSPSFTSISPQPSPGFAYPTPPASHEGQSPFISVPMESPHGEEFGMEREGLPQASSPLSAAFYTSTMSSSAAVEEAIQEVLPEENLGEDNFYPLPNSPNEEGDLGITPVPSPQVSTSLPSPIANFGAGLKGQTVITGSTLMMPNSDDPLLSSQPKDFVPKKRIQLNGVPIKLLSNQGFIEMNNGHFTGLLVDANGELKLIHAQPNFPAKNFVLQNAQLVTTSQDGVKDGRIKVQKLTLTKAFPAAKLITKKTETGDVFVSPTAVTNHVTPLRQSRKRMRVEPLQLPVVHQSKLRTTRSKPQGSRFTPAPILNPQRQGTGLYHNIKIGDEVSTYVDPIPETDSTPHINLGPQSQCAVPTFTSVPRKFIPQPIYEDLLWDPGIIDCTDAEVDMYLEFACCAAVPGGGRNKEYAMHLLHMCKGNIHEAMLRLMQPTPHLPPDHPLLSFSYTDSERWTSAETELFHKYLIKFDKDFTKISEEIKTKSQKQCVQFYYIWKKVCSDEYGRLKGSKTKRCKSGSEQEFADVKLLGIADSESPMRNFLCEYPDCSASFNSRAALNGHIRIHGGTARTSPTPSTCATTKATPSHVAPLTVSSTICHPDSTDQEYPCKICGKVFPKIKSRSAHMKSHRPPDAEPLKRRSANADQKQEQKELNEPHVPSPFSL